MTDFNLCDVSRAGKYSILVAGAGAGGLTGDGYTGGDSTHLDE